MTTATLGLVGLGTMGANLARNFAGRGEALAVYDRDRMRTNALGAELVHAGRACGDLASLARHVAVPRLILMMVPAGAPVDEALVELTPHLAAGDVVIDGGNSFWRDSERRAEACGARGVHYVGLGVSGGEEGARLGPALMAGGDATALMRVGPRLAAIAARHGDEPCFVACGPGGAGHFVKMVHNGIEYAVMQLQAEAYALLRDLLGLDAAAIHDVFARWTRGPAASFLLECALRAAAAREDGAPLLDRIEDSASQKGTGAWTANAALEFGIAAPTLAAAVHARCLSALKTERVAAARPRAAASGIDPARFTTDLESALAAASAVAHAQGFALIAGAAGERGWQSDLAAVARAWRAGCIIRSTLMITLAGVLARGPSANLLLAPEIDAIVSGGAPAWRRVAAAAIASAVPVPAFASALAYADGYRDARSGANLIAAQRDVFGRHGFKRLDRSGSFHADWPRR